MGVERVMIARATRRLGSVAELRRRKKIFCENLNWIGFFLKGKRYTRMRIYKHILSKQWDSQVICWWQRFKFLLIFIVFFITSRGVWVGGVQFVDFLALRILTFRLVIDMLFSVVMSISLFKSYKVRLKVSFALRESRKSCWTEKYKKFKYRRIGLRKSL